MSAGGASRRLRAGRGLAIAALLGLAAVALAPPATGGDDGEARLRRRVKRFYVLTYLNRPGEMWEMFSASLRERLGGDRREYARSARGSGFELYSSRIERIEMRGETAVVDVSLQARLAGALEINARRHRMAWVHEDGSWRYAGSVDVTHAEVEAEEADLQPPSRVRAPEQPEPEELLPPLRAVELPGPEEQPGSERDGERWDLVAVPPGGRGTEPEARPLPERATETEGEPAAPAPAPPPPSRRASPEPSASPDRAPAGTVADEGTVRLVEKALLGALPRRQRAVARLRRSADPGLADLVAGALPRAPATTAAAFLELLASRGSPRHADAVAVRVEDPDARVRTAALGALGALGGSRHVPLLAARLEGESLDVLRRQAAQALGQVGGPEAGERLHAALASAGDAPSVVAAIVRALGRVGHGPAAGDLVALLDGDAHPDVALAAVAAAGRLATPAAVAALERLLDGATGWAGVSAATRRHEVLLALVAAGAEGAGDRLALELLAQGIEARPADVDAVAAGGSVRALADLLGHPSPAVRRRCLQLAGRFVDGPDEARLALDAIDAAFLEEGDGVTLLALVEARERLQRLAAPAVAGPSSER